MAWSKGRRPSGAVLHSSREPGVRRPCGDFMDMLRRLINCHIIIIIIFITKVVVSNGTTCSDSYQTHKILAFDGDYFTHEHALFPLNGLSPKFASCIVNVTDIIKHVILNKIGLKSIYRVRQKKVNPCRIFQIFKQPLRIF